jgi:hypothetical protein
MAIITPLKKIFNWQTASEKIPYKVYTAYITVDDSENMYASQVLENTIGAVTFESPSPGYWLIKLPYSVPRLKIMIPGFGDFICNNNGVISTDVTTDNYRLTMYPGLGIDDAGPFPLNNNNVTTNCIGINIYEPGVGSVSWRTFFTCAPTGLATSYPIEIRVYN